MLDEIMGKKIKFDPGAVLDRVISSGKKARSLRRLLGKKESRQCVILW